MGDLSETDLRQEPAMLKAAKMAHFQRRAVLAQHLEDSLHSLCSFGDCQAFARNMLLLGESRHGPCTKGASKDAEPVSPTTLQHVWQALHTLGLRDRLIVQLADQARQS